MAKEDQAQQEGDAGDPQQAAEVSDVELSETPQQTATGPAGQIDILLETSMSVSACLGEIEMSVRDLLQMAPGSVLQLNKQVGQPVDLLLRGIPFATGSLVVVGEQLGVRVREILSPAGPLAAAEVPDADEVAEQIEEPVEA